MKYRPIIIENANLRLPLCAIATLVLILTNWSASPAHPLPTSAQPALTFPPEGDWYTYANGDEILTLAMQGDILWAGTRAGGVVRWDTTTGSYVQFLKPQDGLAGNIVRDIHIDPNGHKWFATDYGLSILDDKGTPEKADDLWYTYSRETTGGKLPSDRVTAVAIDAAGFLWIGTSQYWDQAAEVDTGETSVVAPAYTGGGLIKVDTKGTLNPSDDALIQKYTVNSTVSCKPREEEERRVTLGLASDNITDILPVAGNRVWVATERHWIFSPDSSDNVCALFQSDPNQLGEWIQTFGGLSRLDHGGTPETDDDVWKTWTCEYGHQRLNDVNCVINQLRLDSNGYIWAAMRGRGVIAFLYNGDRDLEQVKFDKSDGLRASDVAAIAFGPSDDPRWRNTVWLSNYSASEGAGYGVCILNHAGTIDNKEDDLWNELNPTGECLTTSNRLAGNWVQAMVQANGKIWMGTVGTYGMTHGISPFDLGQQTFGDPLVTATSGLPYNYITDLVVGQPGTPWENQVWIGTGNKRNRKYGLGALRLNTQGTEDPGDDTFTLYTKEGTDDNGRTPWTGLASNNIVDLAIDGNNVWFGTQPVTGEWSRGRWTWYDGGLSVYDGVQRKWTTRTDQNTGGDFAGLRSDRISAIAVDCGGEIWIALGSLHDNSGLGINVLDTRGDPHNLSNDDWWDPIRFSTIPSELVTGIAPDCARNQLWISTMPYFNRFDTVEGGVARYDYEIDEWTTWTANEGLETYARDRVKAEMTTIHVGPDGTTWAGAWGSRALSREALIEKWPFVPATINWFQDGLWQAQVFENDGWISTIAIDRDGIVWAGTSRGGLDIDPADGKPDDNQIHRATGGIKLALNRTEWITWTPENSPLVTNDIAAIAVAPDGNVWISTNGSGLMRFDPAEPLTPVPTTSGTPGEIGTPPPGGVTWTPTPTPTTFGVEGASPTPDGRIIYRAYMPIMARGWFGRPIPTHTPTLTPTPSHTPRITGTLTSTPTPTNTVIGQITNTPTQPGSGSTLTVTLTPTPTATPSPTATPTATPTAPAPSATGVWCPDAGAVCSDVSLPQFPERDLYDITFTDSQHGFIIGENGFVARTTDGGNTWIQERWGSATLRDIFMLDNRVGFVAGDNKTILQTTNGGNFFSRLQMPSDMLGREEDFWSVYALSEDNAWAMGRNDGCILHWDGQQLEFGIGIRCTGFPYTGLAMPAPDLGWAISADGFIYRYNNNGWSEASAMRASGPLWAVKMSSATDGWAAGESGLVVHNTNGQWTETSPISGLPNGRITGLHITSSGNIFASAAIGSGERADGAIYQLQGNRWQLMVYTFTTQLNAVWMNDSRTSGWAIGHNGYVMRYFIPSN